MRRGQIVEISEGYRKNFCGRKYGVISSLKFLEDRPILEVTIPLENGMRVKADIDRVLLKPVEEEEVTL